MKPLILHCTPRTDSKTATLAAHAASLLPGAQQLDLAAQPPDLLNRQRVDAYTRRNYGGEHLGEQDAAALAGMDALTQQLIGASHVVLAFPVYNFSVPAAVKAWFDAVVQKGRTWIAGPDGFRGLLTQHRGLIIASSGGRYEGETAADEHATRLAEANLRFMGFADIQIVTASGMNLPTTDRDSVLASAREQISSVIQGWG